MRKITSQHLHKTSALPPNINVSLDGKEEQIFNFIRAACQDIGTLTGQAPTARVAGGWVRDKFLGRPSKDIDITVDTMGGDEFAKWLHQIAERRFGNKQRVVTEATTSEERPEQIKNLAVAFLRIFGQEIEILPLRGNEVYQTGSRNPVSTERVGPEDDAFRRDLTINSMFYNINTGQVEDFTGQGYDDLLTMTLRTPTRHRHQPIKEATRILSEDPLRVLRILRFHSRYPNAKIAPEVLEAMKNPEIQHQITRRLYGDIQGGIVPERTAEELKKLFAGEQPEESLKIMHEIGLLQNMLLLPESYHPLTMDQRNLNHAQTLIDHTISVVGNVNKLAKEFGLNDKQRTMMNIAALFHDLGKLDPRSHVDKPGQNRGYYGDPGREDSITHEQASQERWDTFAQALKLSEEESNTISDLVGSHMRPHSHIEGPGTPSDKMLRRYLRKNPSWVFQYIHAMADSMSKGAEPDPAAADPYRANLERLRALAPNADQYGNAPRLPDLLNGQQIIQIVGLPPKPPSNMTGYIEVVKESIRELQDQNPELTPEEAIRFVQHLANTGQQGQGILAPYFQSVVQSAV